MVIISYEKLLLLYYLIFTFLIFFNIKKRFLFNDVAFSSSYESTFDFVFVF